MKKLLTSVLTFIALAAPNTALANIDPVISGDLESAGVAVQGCAIESVDYIRTLLEGIRIEFPTLNANLLGLVEPGSRTTLFYHWDVTVPPELQAVLNGPCGHAFNVDTQFSYNISEGPLVVGSHTASTGGPLINIENLSSTTDWFVAVDLPADFTGIANINQYLSIDIEFEFTPNYNLHPGHTTQDLN